MLMKEWGKNQVIYGLFTPFFFLFYFDKPNTEKKKQNLKEPYIFFFNKTPINSNK
jgi:hypothetical protein